MHRYKYRYNHVLEQRCGKFCQASPHRHYIIHLSIILAWRRPCSRDMDSDSDSDSVCNEHSYGGTHRTAREFRHTQCLA